MRRCRQPSWDLRDALVQRVRRCVAEILPQALAIASKLFHLLTIGIVYCKVSLLQIRDGRISCALRVGDAHVSRPFSHLLKKSFLKQKASATDWE